MERKAASGAPAGALIAPHDGPLAWFGVGVVIEGWTRDGFRWPAHPRVSDWRYVARAGQLPPEGDWSTWLVMAGRGFGKTRTGAEWVQSVAIAHPGSRIAMIGATAADVKAVMVFGEAGLMAVAPPAGRPKWKSDDARLEWPGGSVAETFGAVNPEMVRGHAFDFAWCDELAHWRHPEAVWANLKLALRRGNRPRVLVSTTPKPMGLLRALLKDDRIAVSRGGTRENVANLPAAYLEEVYAAFDGREIGRQELDGELLSQVPGALWSLDMIAAGRKPMDVAAKRVLVGVDPPATDGTCGIVVVALGADDEAYVLADCSIADVMPTGWGRAVLAAVADYRADAVVIETNMGGRMVADVLRQMDAGVKVIEVRAAAGKVARAEPLEVPYRAGRVHHTRIFEALEAEMCGMVVGGGYAGPGRSPDRADALVWGLTELLRLEVKGPRVVGL
ncbi:terminase large subunit domain-containing protein [Sandaracinobacteroides saxicola]|uniref:DNA-packaging protein n=1 Tax=Sandaracinobacteroides saxicola TaxID=2759707 RepID=A0A7G5IJ33_9SPHN|nr:terminase family protein [Sandaracinobacteroides saxicola]QMW23375.1 DNA-packaging protein [Sandaracinobacteroides saxicola]